MRRWTGHRFELSHDIPPTIRKTWCSFTSRLGGETVTTTKKPDGIYYYRQEGQPRSLRVAQAKLIVLLEGGEKYVELLPESGFRLLRIATTKCGALQYRWVARL